MKPVPPKDQKAERLAAALRRNLRLRKAAAQPRAEEGEAPPPGAGGEE